MKHYRLHINLKDLNLVLLSASFKKHDCVGEERGSD